ncbi:virulence sensor protein [Bordetella ansorpii]|uniref:histidine kinase n=2 Tax=Bordetella ansorpii TaxID=288768 RepID=A0A157SI60_9BORD|nr:virulence sensor protein [Bordetella ansorpii]
MHMEHPSRLRGLFPLLVLWLCGVFCLQGDAWAREAAPRAPVDLASVADRLPLADHLSSFQDRDGLLTAEQALRRDWPAASAQRLNRGFTASAIWLRGEFVNNGQAPALRWLSVGVPRLEDVRFFVFRSGATEPSRTVLAGNRLPIGEGPVPSALSVLDLTLQPGERATVLIRVQSRSAVTIDAALWMPDAFREADQRGGVILMLLEGGLAMIAVYALVLGLAQRDVVFLLLGVSLVAEIFYSLSFQGLLYRYLLTDGGEAVLRAPSVFSTLAMSLFSLMAMLFAGLHRIRYWKWIYCVLSGAGLLGAVWAAFGDYRYAALSLTSLVFLLNLVWVVSMIDGWRRGHANARLFLLSFSIYCAALFVRLAFIHGWLPGRWGGGPEIAWDLLSVSLMMAMILYGRSRQLREAREAAQRELFEARGREQERLERAVTERTQALREALIAADEASRVRQDFLARISHDLRTPLTSIIGFADLIQAGGRDDAPRGAIIRRSADHMLGMVNDLIDYAAGADGQAVRPAPVYIHALLDTVAKEAASLAARRGNRFVLEVAGGLPAVLEMDGKRVRQVLGNLIDNAVKFTAEGTVSLHVAYADAIEGQSGTLQLAIVDTGCGIALQDQERIFEPFQRLDAARDQPGVGLGLSIVQQWVQRMHGTLEVLSAVGTGTTFLFTLPTRALDESQVVLHYMPDAAAVLPPIDGQGRRIWVAEDTPEIRDFLVEELASLGFEVESSDDGLAMLARIALPDAQAPDLILTDHDMAGADGMAVLAAAKQRWGNVPVVVVSATPHVAEDDAEAGVLAYDASLLKPVNLAELRNTLARLLALPRSQAMPAVAEPRNGPQRPGAEALANGRRLLDSGAVSDLVDWADGLQAEDARLAVFCEEVRRLARMGDLQGLQGLCAA